MTVDTNILANIESFDPRAFLGGPDVPQSVCDLVLSLAVFYNDIRDVTHATLLLESERPQGEFSVNKQNGEYSGLAYHLFRVRLGLLHELLKLLCKAKTTIADQSMIQIVERLSREAREAWEALVNIANGIDVDPRFTSIILMIRHKVSFHYDSKAIQRGFTRHFCGDERSDDYAYISRGRNMGETRYYFADAAAYGFLRTLANDTELTQLESSLHDFGVLISAALLPLISRFIQFRKCPFRQYRAGRPRVVK